MTTRRGVAPPLTPTAAGPRTPKQRAGARAEQAACEYLIAQGCSIVARNQRLAVLFVVFQRHIVRSIVVTGLK